MSEVIVQPTGQAVKLPFWRQLRWNLILYFVILAVLPVVVVQLITLSLTTQNARDSVLRQLESVAELKSNQLRRWVQEANTISEVILADSSRYAKLREFLTAAEPNTVSNTPLAQDIERFLQDAAASEGSTSDGSLAIFRDLFIYNPQGTVVVASDNVLVGKVVTRQPYFTTSLEGVYLQPPFYALESGELTVIFTRPLLAGNNTVLGVLAGRLNLETLRQIMTERAGLGETGETYLVSAETNYLLTPSRFDGYSLNHAYHSQGIDSALAGTNGSGLYPSYRTTRDQVIGVYRWIPELKVALIAEIAEVEAFVTVQQVLNAGLALAIVAALIAVLIGLNRITRISAPITTLANIAIRIAGGDFTERATLKEQNEIGQLASSFNRMTENLVTNIQELDRNVEQLNTTNSALEVATAKAREAARVKGEFLANVSHELRTPLNAIIGFSDMLLMGMSGALNDKQHHKVTRLKENGARLLTLINDLLDLTRIEAGRLETVQSQFSPRAMIERIAAQMESLAVESNLMFETKLDPGLPEQILGDEKRTEQVIVNLLSNAFKFTKEGAVTLKVYANNLDETWNIDVTDTGIGIPPHALNLIFEEFRQLDGSYSRAYKGTGLGLAITRNLTRLMGGKINVKSALGVGSTFSVTLPMVTQPETVFELGGVHA